MTVPNAGSAEVSIVPDLSRFPEQLRAQVVGIGDKIGSDIGKALADAINREVGVRTKDMPVGPDKPTTTRKGQDTGGAFADGFKARVEAALKTLPPISIGAATTEAEQKIRDLKVDLATLASQRIGVDISDDEAIAKLDDLRARLAEINGESSNVQVKADTAAALAQLDRFKAEIDKLKTEEVHVEVEVEDHGSIAETDAKLEASAASADTAKNGISGIGQASSSSLPSVSLLGAGIFAFGPAAVGAAAVAIPAIIAIGAAITGAIAGIGVLALGFSGIGDALSAAGQKPSGGGSSGQNAAINAQQQRLSAQQATQSAADQLTSSLERQQQAQQAVTTAERNELQAQQALTQARQQAEQDLQDLNNQLTVNALSQRQAALTLADAAQQLQLVKAAPGAGLPQYQEQIQQAQLAYDQAKQNAAELALTGSRLADQQKSANAAGVNGAPGVVSAQQAVADAHTNTQQAQQGAADAAHALAEAQANVTTTALQNSLAAQQAANSISSAAASTNSFAAAMAKLNPIQRQFVEFLLPLKPLFDELKTAASGFLPGLEAGITNALPAFKPLLDLVSAIAKSLGGVFSAIGTALAGPEGQKFLGFLTTELPNQIGFLGTLFVQVGRIFSGVFEQFAPVIKIIDDAVVGFFTNLGDKAQNNGFANFLKEVTPLIGPVFGALSAVGNLIAGAFQAILPAIGPSLGLFTTLAKVLSGLLTGPVGQGLGKLWGDLLTAITPLLPVFAKLLTGVLPPLIKFLDQLAVQIFPQLIPFLTPFVDAFIKLAQGLTPGFDAIIKGLSDALTQLAPQMPALDTALSNLVIAVVQLLPALAPLIPPLLDLFTTALAKPNIALLVLFASAIKGISDALVQVLPYIANFAASILKGLNTALNTVNTFFINIGPKIVSFIGGADTWLNNIGHDVITGLLNGIKAAFNPGGDLWLYLFDLGSKIPSYIGDLSKVLLGAGGDLISGLIKGIENAAKGGLHTALSGALHLALKALPGADTALSAIGLAAGGLVTKPTLALLGEGGENEYVVPQSKLSGFLGAMTSAMSSHTAIPLNSAAVTLGASQLGSAYGVQNAASMAGAVRSNTFNIHGVTDPNQVAVMVGNRLAARAA